MRLFIGSGMTGLWESGSSKRSYRRIVVEFFATTGFDKVVLANRGWRQDRQYRPLPGVPDVSNLGAYDAEHDPIHCGFVQVAGVNCRGAARTIQRADFGFGRCCLPRRHLISTDYLFWRDGGPLEWTHWWCALRAGWFTPSRSPTRWAPHHRCRPAVTSTVYYARSPQSRGTGGDAARSDHRRRLTEAVCSM